MSVPCRSIAIVVLAIGVLSVPVAGSFQAETKPSGIYVQVAGQTGAEWQRLSGAMVEDVQVNGIAKSMLTGGFLRPRVTGSIAGATAAARLPSGNLLFEFHFAEMPSGRSLTMDEMLAMHGDSTNALPMQAKKPGEFTLVLLQPAEGRRPIGDKSPSFKFKERKLSTRVFQLTPNAPLPPGEYGFLFGKNGAAGMVWDFGVDGP